MLSFNVLWSILLADLYFVVVDACLIVTLNGASAASLWSLDQLLISQRTAPTTRKQLAFCNFDRPELACR